MQVTLTIKRGEKTIKKALEITDEQLLYKRERAFNIANQIGKIIEPVVKEVIEDYEEEIKK